MFGNFLYQLKDDVLTYNIEKGSKDLEKITDLAFSEWEKNLYNIHFKNVKDYGNADIAIKFKKGKLPNSCYYLI